MARRGLLLLHAPVGTVVVSLLLAAILSVLLVVVTAVGEDASQEQGLKRALQSKKQHQQQQHQQHHTGGLHPGSKDVGGAHHNPHPSHKVELLSLDKMDKARRQYGSELPAFTHDYSELVMSAMIERGPPSPPSNSNSNQAQGGGEDLHLTMFLMGHRVLVDNFPFESLSTDEHVLLEWNQAVRRWNPGRNISYLPSNYLCVIRNNLLGGTTGGGGDKTEKHGPFHDTIGGPSTSSSHHAPYISPAVWVPAPATSSGGGSDKLHGNLEILRCKIKTSGGGFGKSAKGKLSKSSFANTDRSLYVDLVNKRRHNKNSQVRIHRHLTDHQGSISIKNNSSASSSSAQTPHTQSHDPRALLLSFSVPWQTRTRGFGLSFDRTNNLSAKKVPGNKTQSFSQLDAWTNYEVNTGTRNQHRNNQQQPLSGSDLPQVAVCSGRLRPRNSFRPQVSSPMLIEFLESLTSFGVSHTFLSVFLDRSSVHMQRYLLGVAPYIEAGLVSLFSPASFHLGTSSADPNPNSNMHDAASSSSSSASSSQRYDDAAGLLGVHLNERYFEWIFLNQCLYFNKGAYDYVLVMEPTDFIVALPPGHFLNIPKFLQAQIDSYKEISSSSNDHVIPHNSKSNSSSSNRGVRFVFNIAAVGISDPAEAFGTWGPADSSWTPEYFSSVNTVISEASSQGRFTYKVMIAPTEGTFFLTHNESSHRFQGIQRSPPSSTSSLSSSSTFSSGISNIHHTYSIAESSIIKLEIPFDSMRIYKYKGIFEGINDDIHNLKSVDTLTLPMKDDEKGALQLYWASIREKVTSRGYPAKAGDLKKSVSLLAKAEPEVASYSDPPLGSLTMKAPFWQPCDIERFKDVLSRVFHVAT